MQHQVMLVFLAGFKLGTLACVEDADQTNAGGSVQA